MKLEIHTWTFILSILFLYSCKETKQELPTYHEIPQGMVLIPAGQLLMGGNNEQAASNEYPQHPVDIKTFLMDATEVTNADFAKFVEATNYITVAERPIIWDTIQLQLPPNTPKPADSLLQAGSLVFKATSQPVPLDNPGNWWHWVIGANWKHPEGPESDILEKMDHPVVQVSWEDAMAYAKWQNKRLPTEAEWEWAARGGLKNMIYPWGNEKIDVGTPKANFWQGFFPYKNTLRDKYFTTAPVKSFEPNAYGLYDMAGNVWEWCQDWFDEAYYGSSEAKKPNTIGPEKAYNSLMPFQQEKVVRGGSFLCSDEYCSGYRASRRMGSTTDTGLNHTGFRCVKDIP